MVQEGERIYVIVARTVLTPILTVHYGRNAGRPSIGRSKDTRAIVQPTGRMAAQAVHVGRKIEHELIIKQIRAAKIRSRDAWKKLPYQNITTIVLEARDTFELMHVKGLLEQAGIKVSEFMDTNEYAYGTPEEVLTAIATHPVSPFQVVGALDYLPLLP